MNEHAGPACALSVLIVGVFAILLHDKTRVASHQNPVARTVMETVPAAKDSPLKITTPEPVADSPGATRSAGPSSKDLQATSNGSPDPSDDQPKITEQPLREVSFEVSEKTPDRTTVDEVRVLSTKKAPTRSAFTVVLAGETLEDVSTRVYGSNNSTETLWKANRDRLTRIDSPLTRGTLLRTP